MQTILSVTDKKLTIKQDEIFIKITACHFNDVSNNGIVFVLAWWHLYLFYLVYFVLFTFRIFQFVQAANNDSNVQKTNLYINIYIYIFLFLNIILWYIHISHTVILFRVVQVDWLQIKLCVFRSVITFSPYRTESNPLFSSLKIHNLCDNNNSQIALFMFQAKFNLLPFSCAHYVELSTINLHYEIRNQSEFDRVLYRTLVRGRCIVVSGPVL